MLRRRNGGTAHTLRGKGGKASISFAGKSRNNLPSPPRNTAKHQQGKKEAQPLRAASKGSRASSLLLGKGKVKGEGQG